MRLKAVERTSAAWQRRATTPTNQDALTGGIWLLPHLTMVLILNSSLL